MARDDDDLLKDPPPAVADMFVKPEPPPALGDSIEDNLEILGLLFGNMPRSAFERSKAAAKALEREMRRIVADHPRDPATALGLAFAAHQMAKLLVKSKHGDDASKSLIELIS